MSQIETTDRDARVLDQLRNELAAFDLELSSPEKVIRQVATLVGKLRDVDVSFVEEIRRVWWPVEFTFALSVDEERPLTEEENRQLREAVDRLEELVGPSPHTGT